jgi:seryl-tRNA synthetase
MLDIDLIRRNPDLVQQALRNRGDDSSMETILELDTRHRRHIHEGDELRARRNQASQEIGKGGESSPERRQELRLLGERVKELEEEARKLQQALAKLLLVLPNIPRDDVPVGHDETGNAVVRSWGEPAAFDFEPKAHWDLNDGLGIIDFQRGVKLSGSRFYVLKGAGAALQRALITWMLDLHTREHSYTEIYPPVLVRQEVMQGSGNLPKFRDNLYFDHEDDLWLLPSAEVALTGLHRDEILEPGTLPLHYAAYTPCFRREKAAAGRDTRGIKRVHQFDKVELYKFVEPEWSDDELDSLMANAEEVLRLLGLPYRVVQLCTGDLGFQSAKTYDLEAWAPGCQEWLEVSSCSNCTDFQARRSNIRFRREARGRPEFVHTINGSGLAIPRVMIAILETYQQPDGTVTVPEVLRPHLGMDVINTA